MSLKAKIEAIIYAAEEPITVEQISTLVKDLVLAEEQAAAQAAAATLAEESAESQSPEQAHDVEQTELPDAALAETQSSDVSTDETPAVEVPEKSPDAIPETPAESVEPEPATEVSDPGEATTTEPAPEAVSEPSEPAEPVSAAASVEAPEPTASKKKGGKKEVSEDARIRVRVRQVIQELAEEYERFDRGMEIRAVAGGFRMSTKPEHHDVVRAFAKSLKPPVRLSLAALETLAVIAYKQPVTVPEISEIRGVESGGVIGTLLDRKLITTAGRKQVVGRPILYKTAKEFLMRFGLNDLAELPSMEEFEKLAADGQGELFTPEAPAAQPQTPGAVASAEEGSAASGEPVQETAEAPAEGVQAESVAAPDVVETSAAPTAEPATPAEEPAQETASELSQPEAADSEEKAEGAATKAE